jgi:DNA-binding transcriptional ArsR family regulator
MRLDSPKADLLFTALANKTRRRILQRLSQKPARSISELARAFGISNTAASNQIKILEQAELVIRSQQGKYNHVILAPERTLKILLAIASQFS